MALSQPPNVRLTFLKNLDRCQESNLNSSDGYTSSDCSRLTSRSILASGDLYTQPIKLCPSFYQILGDVSDFYCNNHIFHLCVYKFNEQNLQLKMPIKPFTFAIPP